MRNTGIILLSFISILLMGINHSFAQNKVVPGPEWNFVLGDWIGDGTGVPGEAKGWFTFNKDLDGNILIRKNHNVIPANNGKPAAIHDDLLIVYLDNTGALTKAIYFDNENHVINYAISFNQADKSLTFTSEAQKNMPRFRLTYKATETNGLNIDFEFAPPNQPEAFTKYISGKAHRKTPSEKFF
jgi:hypothetical protein